MEAASSIPTDPVSLVNQLDADVITERLKSLERERQALMVLLRAAKRAQRPQGSKGGKQQCRR